MPVRVLLFLFSLALWEESSVVGEDSTVRRRRQQRDDGRSSSVSQSRYDRLVVLFPASRWQQHYVKMRLRFACHM
jgi:hypothetical protein